MRMQDFSDLIDTKFASTAYRSNPTIYTKSHSMLSNLILLHLMMPDCLDRNSNNFGNFEYTLDLLRISTQNCADHGKIQRSFIQTLNFKLT